MNLSPDEARKARIQKYKEERKIQLTARTATLLSANVTQRKPRKPVELSRQGNSEDLKASSELNINTASTSVPIRTTRASRLRAAASNQTDTQTAKVARSSSVQSLVGDSKTKTITRNPSLTDKTKSSSIRPSKKENVKTTTDKSVANKEIGASKLKFKHSIDKNILETNKNVVNRPNNVEHNIRTERKRSCNENSKVASRSREVEGNKRINIVENKAYDCDRGVSSSFNKVKLYSNVADKSLGHKNKLINVDLENSNRGLKNKLNENNNIPVVTVNELKADDEVDNVQDQLAEEKEETGGLLGVACVQKVERFSELLSNLCSPAEADILFEDILAENGIDDVVVKPSPECTPCRRVQPSPRVPSTTPSTPKRTTSDAAGSTAKTKSRRPLETSPTKTENALPSSKISFKSNFNSSTLSKSSPQKVLASPASNKGTDRRRSTEITSTKPSCIPLSKKTAELLPSSSNSSVNSPVKDKLDTKSKIVSSKSKSVRRSQDTSDSENTNNEKYHYKNKRLISVEKKLSKDANTIENSKATITNKSTGKLRAALDSEKSDKPSTMYTLHETVRPHTSRLSQEMDSLTALTKRTLDRVNKLSNNLNINKNLDVSEPRLNTILVSNSENNINSNIQTNDNAQQPRGVTERLRDIDMAAQRLIDFEKQSAMFCDLSNDASSQKRRNDCTSASHSHTPVSILKRKSIHDDSLIASTTNHTIASPPVTFSPSVLEPRQCRPENRQRQGILKKRRSLDESQVIQRRSCSPEVSFADDSSSDVSKPILKNRRSSLEDIVRNSSPDNQIQGILKRKMSREEEHIYEDLSHGSPEPHGILKRKSNSSSSSSTTSSHVSIAQAVLLAAAGGAELVDDDKEIVRPILKKKSFSEERPSSDTQSSETPKPILKKKSIEHEEHDFDLPKKPILKTPKRLNSDEGHTSSFDMSEEDRTSRRSSLLRSRTSDQSGSECEATVRPILKQRGSSLTRERSQSPRPRLSFCADNGADICLSNFSNDANDLLAAGPRRVINLSLNPEDSAQSYYPSAVLRRRNLRPKNNPRSKSLACDLNDELTTILNSRRIKVDENCESRSSVLWEATTGDKLKDEKTEPFPSVAFRIKNMEKNLTGDTEVKAQPSTSRVKKRDKERYKTQPVTIEEMRIASSLDPGQAGFQAFSNTGCSFPSRPHESGTVVASRKAYVEEPEKDPYVEFTKTLDSPPFGVNFFDTDSQTTPNGLPDVACAKDDSFGEATFLDFENIVNGCERRESTLDEIEKEVNKVRVALDEDCRALDEDERHQAEADTWSLNVSCDSGVYNRASSRDSGPHSGEELGLIESQEIKENQEVNSSTEWSPSSMERGFLNMDRERKSTEVDQLRSDKEQDSDEEEGVGQTGFALGLIKSNSVVARASMWQQLQQQARGQPKPLVRHSRSKAKDIQSVADRFKSQATSPPADEVVTTQPRQSFSLAQSKSAANMLDRDEDDLDDDSPTERAQRMITPEVRGILKSGTTIVPTKHKTLAKGESSEGLKDEGIDSSSDEETATASTVSSSEKSCSSSDSSDEVPGPKPRRFQRKNKLKSSRTDSDITRVVQNPRVNQDSRKVQLPGADELKERLAQAKNSDVKIPLLGKLGKKPTEEPKKENEDDKYRRFVKKIEEPIQLGKLRRSTEKVIAPVAETRPEPILKISALNQEAKNKFFGLDTPIKKEKNIDELTAAVRKYIPPPVTKSISSHAFECVASGSDGESSGGREVRRINTRGRHRVGSGVQRSATHAEMPNRGGTIAERLAALQAAGANDWRARVCRLSPDKEDSKAIERAKNMINDTLNAAVDEKKKVNIEDNELGQNILADRRNKLETAAQGWRKRVPQNDATLFTVAGRLERDKVTTTPPLTPPPVPAPATPASPGVPSANKFRSRKQQSPTNGFASGPLRSASCVVVSGGGGDVTPVQPPPKHDRDAFKRSLSVSDSISRVDEKEEISPGAEKSGIQVRVPRADDETFHAFFTPVLPLDKPAVEQDVDIDVDLDAIDSGSRQMLCGEWARRAKRAARGSRRGAARNPLRALAARTDLRPEYCAPPRLLTQQMLLTEKATANCGLAAEALAALASKEDFSRVALRSAATPIVNGTKQIMLLQVKGRRRVQTRLVEPVHTSVNRGDCFILVTPDQVFLYIGQYANVIERNRSTDIALHIHNTKDLGCKNSTGVTKIDEISKNYSNKHWNQFWSLLGVTEEIEDYKPAETGHADEDEIFESCIVQTNMCYEVMDDELVPIHEYWGQLPKIAMLHQSKVIVFDFGSELYIWYGKNVPLESRRRAAQLAQELFDDGYDYEKCHINPLNAAFYQGARSEFTPPPKTSKSRPDWAILSKVTQHMETILFKEKFLDWPDYSRVIKVKPQENKSNSVEITPCDAEEMWSNEYQDPDLILEGSHVGRGTHYYDKENMKHYDIKTKSVRKWVIREYDYQKVENEAEIGEFFSGDSYIIRWEYIITATGRELNGKPSKHNITGRDRCAYFCWQGKDASSNEKGAAALLTVELDKEKGPQVRVAQGNETPAFLNLFQGNLIIYQGKKDTDKSRYKLFVTRGNVPNEAYLLQVPCSVRQLRSRGSLLLVDTEKGYLYIWHGARSLKHTKNVAIELANKLIARKSTYLFGDNVADVKITEVKEGEECKEVLDALGVANKQYYNSMLSSSNGGPDVTPRLFHFTDLGGQFEANEVLSPLRHEHLVTPFPFDQKELYSASQPALFLLDDGKTVWLWQGWWPRGEDGELEPAEINSGVGAFAGRWQAMRACALRTCDAYLRVSRAAGPDPAARLDVSVVAAGLEPKAFTDLFDTWVESDDAAEANIAHGFKAGAVLGGLCELSRLSSCAVLPLAALQRRPLPDHVDPHHLERHLASPDFLEAFGMTKDQFEVLPAWKQTNMKKDVGLF